MKKLILLRPNEGALQSAIIAHEMGFDPIIAPASEIHPLPWEAPPAQDFDAIMITSANALRIANSVKGTETLRQYSHLPLFAVGKATAKLAEEMGFTITGIGQGGAKALWPIITQSGSRNILRLVGRDYVDIHDPQIKTTTVMIYEARALPIHHDLHQLIKTGGAPHIFAFHSTRAVQIFDDYIVQLTQDGLSFDPSQHYASVLAPSIATAIDQSQQNWHKIIISPSANDRVMMQTISETLGA